MRLRQAGALVLIYVTGCAGTPRALSPETDPAEAELAAARYELHVLTAGGGPSEAVEVDTEDFQRAMRVLAPGFRPPAQPAHWLMEGSLQADLLAEVERERVVRLMPLEDKSPLEVASAEEMTRKYLGMCQELYGGGDCLGFLADGPTLTREDLRTLALALALKDVLKETGVALKGMVSPQALVAMLVWSCCVYLMLWLPAKDPVGDALQAAVLRVRGAWSRADLSNREARAIRETLKQGDYIRARLMERMFRGQWVERQLRNQFKQLQWSQTGVDAVDPATGLKYEILTGTDWNMELHGRRMAEEFFRMITF